MGFYIPGDGILHSHRPDNLKSYIFGVALCSTILPLRFELRFKARISSHLRSLATCLINILPNQILPRFESGYSAEEEDCYI
jgi:hypothetical protein